MTYFLECTHTCETALNTGIQRVVRNVVNHSLVDASRHVVPVRLNDGSFVALEGGIKPPQPKEPSAGLSWMNRMSFMVRLYLREVYWAFRHLVVALLPWAPLRSFLMAPRHAWGLTRMLLLPMALLRKQRDDPPAAASPLVSPGPGDVLVLLDSSWHLPIWPAVAQARERGASVICVCYDLIPLTHPHFCDRHLAEVFRSWTDRALELADGFVCISRTVAEQLRTRLSTVSARAEYQPNVQHFWLGSELDGKTENTSRPLSVEVTRLVECKHPIYMYVGTLEPRKNHDFAMDIFNKIWNDGFSAIFVIVGRVGWLCEDLLSRIKNSPHFGSRLFMFNHLNDFELDALYERVNGLVFTSVTEGFGLPIVEAIQRGVPVFASDIDVFREIGHDRGVQFLDLLDAELASRIIIEHIRTGAPRLEKPIDWLNWSESTQQFWLAVEGCANAGRR